MIQKQRKTNIIHIICIVTTLCFVLCSVFVFRASFWRLVEAFRDFGLSFAHYFCKVFQIPLDIPVSVNRLPELPIVRPGVVDPGVPVVPSVPVAPIPQDYDTFLIKLKVYGNMLINRYNFLSYINNVGNVLFYLLQILVVALPFIILFRIILKRYFKQQNNDYNIDSKPLRIFKLLSSKTYLPLKNSTISLFRFLSYNRYYIVLWVLIWLYNFRAFVIVLEFLAYYLYFIVTFDVTTIYLQVYKLCIDLMPMITFVPVWLWVVIGVWLIDSIRRRNAYRVLRSMEYRDRAFIESLPVSTLLVGSMGTKKTTMATDMGLSQAVMFKDKAFEKILENDLKFPNFPWINLENAIRQAMEHHEIYNLATAKLFVRKKSARWERNQSIEKLFDYDYYRYGFTYDDGLKTVDIWDVLEIYTQLYFIYIIQSSLLISNYSVRSDMLMQDLGNFPMWNSDFFDRDSRLIDSFSRHAHILDFDSLRLGKKIVQDNIKANSFEFGVLMITEAAKERGNMLELQGLRKLDEQTNQKNDAFDKWIKTVRHSATVDNFPFVRIIMDDQRPDSLGADTRQLCDIVHIRSSSDRYNTLFLWDIDTLVYDLLFSRFVRMYSEFRFNRGDNTLLLYLIKTITTKIHSLYERRNNLFGFFRLELEVESGAKEGQYAPKQYYLSTKKIYAKRFSTDAFNDFFYNKSLTSPLGIADLEEYDTERARLDELEKQNSYLIRDIIVPTEKPKTDTEISQGYKKTILSIIANSDNSKELDAINKKYAEIRRMIKNCEDYPEYVEELESLRSKK